VNVQVKDVDKLSYMYYNMARVKITIANKMAKAQADRVQAELERRTTELAIAATRQENELAIEAVRRENELAIEAARQETEQVRLKANETELKIRELEVKLSEAQQRGLGRSEMPMMIPGMYPGMPFPGMPYSNPYMGYPGFGRSEEEQK
jgi:hypothetical protein